MNSLEKLKSWNPNLQNGAIVPEAYDALVVVAKKVSGEDGDTAKYQFEQWTNPSEAAKKVGVQKQRYLRVSFIKAGSVGIDETTGEEIYQGSKRPQPGNVFKNTQPGVYNFLLTRLDKGEGEGWEKAGTVDVTEGEKTVKRMQVRVKAKVAGAKVALSVPPFEIHTRNAEGKVVKLKGPKYDPKEDRYLSNAPRIGNTLRFFADLEDLEEVEGMAVRLYERDIMPYETGETITQTSKGNTVLTKVESDPVSDLDTDNDEPDTEETEENNIE